MKCLMTVMVAAMLAFAGCGGEEEGQGSGIDTSMPGNPNAGAAIYQRICVACHGADGTGNGGVTGGNFIGQPERLQQDNEVLIAVIRDGKLDVSPPMPAQGQALNEQEIKDVLSYIRREFGQQ